MKVLISSSVIIYNKNNQVLLAKRDSNKKIDPNLWETIGGFLEFGESPTKCLRREVREELNCELSNIELFDVYSFVNNKIGQQVISVQYIATINNELPKFNKKEIAELRWFNKVEISKLKFAMNCKERVLDYFRRKKL